MLKTTDETSRKATDSVHILVADDDPAIHRLFESVLRGAGHEVTLAENGEDAFAKVVESRLSARPVDLLLTDLEMPNWDGVQLIDRMSDEGVDIPVIVATGTGNKDLVVQLLRRQCRDYLDKPVSPPGLLQTVNRVLRAIASERSQEASSVSACQADTEADGYRRSFEKLRGQVDLAVDAYQNLVNPRQEGHNVPFAWKNAPLSELGGDFLDIIDTEKGCDLLIADVAGHDHGASYHTVLIKAFFAENSRAGNGGLSLMRTLNQQLLDNGRNDRMATAMFLTLDLESMMGEVVCAGHPPAIILRKEIPIPLALHTDGSVLGIDTDTRFDVYRFELTPGDRLFLYTDGILDTRQFSSESRAWEKLGVTRFKHLLRQANGGSLHKTVDGVWDSVMRYCRHRPQDDMMLAGIEIPG